jgi:plastocyanin
MKKLIIISLLTIFAVNLFWISQYENTKPHQLIEISESGFTPAHLTISIGQTVVFKNVGVENHWPASDSHPNHTLYDGTTTEQHCTEDSTRTFDSCEVIEPGSSWSFTFNKAGEHEFHDHLWPLLKGKIRVTDPNKELNYGVIDTNSLTSLTERFNKITLTQDPGIAIETLRSESVTDDTLNAFCHDILHSVGKTAYNKYGDFSSAIIYQKDFCNSGYIHGVIEAFFIENGAALREIAASCEFSDRPSSEFERWQCNHGIGHGLMYFTGGDLDQSIKLCSSLSAQAISPCQNGAFMEVFNQEILAKEESFIDESDIFSTCKNSPGIKSDCYIYAPTYTLHKATTDFTSAFALCETVEKGFEDDCHVGIGGEAMKRNMNNPLSVFSLCDMQTQPTKSYCLTGAIGMYMNQMSTYESGKNLCKLVPSAHTAFCSSIVQSREAFFKKQ